MKKLLLILPLLIVGCAVEEKVEPFQDQYLVCTFDESYSSDSVVRIKHTKDALVSVQLSEMDAIKLVSENEMGQRFFEFTDTSQELKAVYTLRYHPVFKDIQLSVLIEGDKLPFKTINGDCIEVEA